VKEFMRGELVNEETLALDWIDRVGPGGDFLKAKHTQNHYRDDWYPTLFNRRNHESWVGEGSQSLRERARDEITRLLAEHQPEALPEDVAKALQGVIDRTVAAG
jgi:trimethylamine--corrinoid protein Co-methyltransferase